MVQLIKTQANNEDNLWMVRTSGKVNHIPMEFVNPFGETYRVDYNWDDLVNALKDLHLAK